MVFCVVLELSKCVMDRSMPLSIITYCQWVVRGFILGTLFLLWYVPGTHWGAVHGKVYLQLHCTTQSYYNFLKKAKVVIASLCYSPKLSL